MLRGFISSYHYHGRRPVPGRPGWLEGITGRAPGGLAGGFPPPTRPGRGDRLDGGVKHGAFARFGAAGGLSLGMAGATIMVAGAGCLLGAWVAAWSRPVRLSTRCIKIPEASWGHFVNPSLFLATMR